MRKRIVAIIPARAGSKGIPNKNIRLINDKPLIYYSINNALNSKLITDVIVTTDSPEVEIISKQMGVQCRRRSLNCVPIGSYFRFSDLRCYEGYSV